MITVAVANLKGGCGKSTISTSLAVRAVQDFDRVAILDLDPNAGAGQWYQLRLQRGYSQEPFVLTQSANVTSALEALRLDRRDLVIIDCGPNSTSLMRQAVEEAEIVIVPTKGAAQDFGSTCDTIEICREAEAPFLMVLNETSPARAGIEDPRTLGAIQIYEREAGPITWGQVLHRRAAFQDAALLGLGVHELASSDARSRGEIEKLYEQIIVTVAKARGVNV